MNRYPIASDSFGPGEIAAAISVIQSGRYTMGQHVREFEQQLAEFMGSKHAVMVNSGSSANLLMVDAMMERNGGSLKPGDGVLVPALAWSTTIAPLIQLGLTPIFCDVTLETLEMRLKLHPRAKAVMPVHVLGRACDMGAIVAFCKANGLDLIEDCCESFGAKFEGRRVGTFGRMGTFSFFFSHHITTMEGGVIVTDDDATADVLRALRAHGWVRDRSDASHFEAEYPDLDKRFLFTNAGYNVRPTELQAAIGKAQLDRARLFIEQRRQYAQRVAELLIGHPLLEMVGTATGERHSWMAFVMRAKTMPGAVMQQRMEALGVDTRSVIAGNLLLHPAFSHLGNANDYPGANRVMRECFMIGCSPTVSPEQLHTLEVALKTLRAAPPLTSAKECHGNHYVTD